MDEWNLIVGLFEYFGSLEILYWLYVVQCTGKFWFSWC